MKEKNYSQKDLGRRLKELLNERKKVQQELADYLEVTQAYISQIIAGKTAMNLTTLDGICKFLDTTPNYLIYGTK